ncbi:hypothetical protein R3W88_008115 [Solanum pinnatisectum]|uniref:Uncharacterized protein n=1 Tax=Solanum pinnatisectum TaxID=50273 RepID=A0AAV9M7M1_9SOLN|nr:hypothetical protein R3W88_008115 [Solanum pinnatisectum]
MTKFPILHKEQVREFYYNVEFTEDGSLNTLVGDKSFHLNEEVLGEILEVPREGTRSVVEKLGSIQKKLMKGEYQLLFEFVNKVLLPRSEKRTVASAADLFLMESLCRFEPLNLPVLILEHMHKTVMKRKANMEWDMGTSSLKCSTT